MKTNKKKSHRIYHESPRGTARTRRGVHAHAHLGQRRPHHPGFLRWATAVRRRAPLLHRWSVPIIPLSLFELPPRDGKQVCRTSSSNDSRLRPPNRSYVACRTSTSTFGVRVPSQAVWWSLNLPLILPPPPLFRSTLSDRGAGILVTCTRVLLQHVQPRPIGRYCAR